MISRAPTALAVFSLCVGLVTGDLQAEDLQPLNDLRPVVLAYAEGDDFGPFAAAAASVTGLDPEQLPAAEQILLDLLDDPGVTHAARLELMALLERVAGPASVIPVGRNLTDPRLSNPARRIIQNIDTSEVDQVLLAALRETNGNLRIGMIASLGRRRTAAAVTPLTELALSDDPATARAAVRALGAIGTPSAFVALDRLEVPDELELVRLDAQLEAAETLRRNGSTIEAGTIARRMSREDYPTPIRLGAYLLLARIESNRSAAIAIEMLKSGVLQLVTGGLHLVAEARPADATRDLAALLRDPDIPAIPLIQALVARGDIAARSALLLEANSDDPAVRAAAVRALGPLGSIDELQMLIARLQANREESRAAADALSVLPEIEVDIELLQIYRHFEDPPAADLAGVLARRNNRAAIPFMLEAALLDNRVGRQSVRALAELARPADIPELLALLDLVPPSYRRGIELAAVAAIKRTNLDPPPLTSILGALPAASAENRVSLLRIAGAAGGTEAAAELTAVYEKGEPEDRRLVESILVRYPSPAYLDLTYHALPDIENPSEHKRLLEGCLEIVNDWRSRRSEQATDALTALAPLARTLEEKTLLLEQASKVVTEGSLAVIQSYAHDPELGEAVALSAAKLASKLDESAHNP